jgi:hypothetical protein
MLLLRAQEHGAALGIAALEDKIVQRVILETLIAICEVE